MKVELPSKKLDCPSCGGSAVSAMRKLNMGAGKSVECRICGVELKASWWSMLPLGLLLYPCIAFTSGKPYSSWILPWFLLFFVLYLFQLYCFPLRRKNPI